jgi:two-component system sensor histidine kinase UhpB
LDSREFAASYEAFPERVHPDDRERTDSSVRAALQTGEPFAFDERIVRPDRTVRALQSKGSVVTDEEGRPIAMIGSCHDGTERKEAEQRAQRPRDQLRALHSRVEQLREEERKALARELHDEIGQTMVALQFHLSWLGGQELSDEAIGRLKAASELVVTVLQAGQRMSTRLRPVVLDGLGLFTAIECEVGEFRWRTGLEWELSLNVEEWTGGLDRATAVYRILQESLTNVARHSEATHVWVSIEGENGSSVVRVEDNGRGFGQD